MIGELAHDRVANDEQLSDAARLHQRALGNLKDGNHARALEDLHASIQLNPYYTQSYYLRGQIFAKQKDSIQAIHDFDKAISQDSSFASALHQRALAHQRSGDYRQALKDFDNALALEPLNALTLRVAPSPTGTPATTIRRWTTTQKRCAQASVPSILIRWQTCYFSKAAFSRAPRPCSKWCAPDRTTATRRCGAIWPWGKPMTIVVPRANSPSNRRVLQRTNAGRRRYSNIISVRSMSLPYTPPLRQPKKSDKAEQQCQANFYVAEAKLLKGAKDEAIARLLTAKNQCPPNTPFFHGANAELKRFGQ